MDKTSYNPDFMEAAFQTALSRCGHTSPNPPVGAVVVKDGVIIARGGTQRCGEDHAEVCALNSAGEAAKGCDLYVTLEPCSHYGKTPPCTDAIIRAGVSRVIISVLDPNPLVSGRGVNMLRAAGIEVVIADEMKDKAIDILRPFFTYIQRGRPYVIHKTAMTADGFTADSDGKSMWISGLTSRYIVHRLRGLCDAVIVGSKTVVADNPSLNVRLSCFNNDSSREGIVQLSKIPQTAKPPLLSAIVSDLVTCDSDPLKVIVGFDERMNEDMKIFNGGNYIVYSSKPNFSGSAFYDKLVSDGRLVVLPVDAFERHMLEDLASRGIMIVMLEGGSVVSGRFFDADLIDEKYCFIAPKLFGSGLPVSSGRGVSAAAPVNLFDVSLFTSGEDVLYHAYLRSRKDVYGYY